MREDGGVGARVLDDLGTHRHELRAQALIALGASWASGFSPAEAGLSRKEQWLREARAK